MTTKQTKLTESDQKQLGIDLFNHVWELMENLMKDLDTKSCK